MQTDNRIFYQLQKRKTSHVLHLILSVITFGLWIPVWILVAISNAMHNGQMERRIRKEAKEPR